MASPALVLESPRKFRRFSILSHLPLLPAGPPRLHATSSHSVPGSSRFLVQGGGRGVRGARLTCSWRHRPEWATWRSPQSLVQEPAPSAGRRSLPLPLGPSQLAVVSQPSQYPLPSQPPPRHQPSFKYSPCPSQMSKHRLVPKKPMPCPASFCSCCPLPILSPQEPAPPKPWAPHTL